MRRAYTVLGWLVWKVGTRMAKRKLAERRAGRPRRLAKFGKPAEAD